MAAFRQNVESAEDRPISESEVMSADRSANEKNTVEPEVERNNDEIVVLKNDARSRIPLLLKESQKTRLGNGGSVWEVEVFPWALIIWSLSM